VALLWDVSKARPDRDLIPPLPPAGVKGYSEWNLTRCPCCGPGTGRWPAAVDHPGPCVDHKGSGNRRTQCGRLTGCSAKSVNTMTVALAERCAGAFARHIAQGAGHGKPLEVAVAIGVHPLLVMAAFHADSGGRLSNGRSPASIAGEGVRLGQVAKPLTWKFAVPTARWSGGHGSPGRGAARLVPFGDHMGFYERV